MLQKFKDCCLINTLIIFIAIVMFYYSPIKIGDDPIIMVGYFVVYLELSKLLYVTATGVEAPILIRYVFAALTVGSAIKTYENMINYNPEKILVFSLVAGVFLLLRYLAIRSTQDGR